MKPTRLRIGSRRDAGICAALILVAGAVESGLVTVPSAYQWVLPWLYIVSLAVVAYLRPVEVTPARAKPKPKGTPGGSPRG